MARVIQRIAQRLLDSGNMLVRHVMERYLGPVDVVDVRSNAFQVAHGGKSSGRMFDDQRRHGRAAVVRFLRDPIAEVQALPQLMCRSIGMVEYSGGVAEDGAPTPPALSGVDA